MIPPLAIVQARIGSTRLPRKMLLPLAGRPLIWHAWNAAVQAFGLENVVIAIPANKENDKLAKACDKLELEFDDPDGYYWDKAYPAVFRWDGPEDDVLGRFYACAHRYRWHPDSVIVRVTPDDPRKDKYALQAVANGQRLPVELGGEAFTLAMLDRAWTRYGGGDCVAWGIRREHITHALFPTEPPAPPSGIWSVDTQADYEAMRKVMEE